MVALAIATPALMLSGSAADTPEIIVFIAFLAALFVFAEYNTVFPSVLEFRDAPPLNRMKFLAFALTVATIAIILPTDLIDTDQMAMVLLEILATLVATDLLTTTPVPAAPVPTDDAPAAPVATNVSAVLPRSTKN